jgi:hypothetical protein
MRLVVFSRLTHALSQRGLGKSVARLMDTMTAHLALYAKSTSANRRSDMPGLKAIRVANIAWKGRILRVGSRPMDQSAIPGIPPSVAPKVFKSRWRGAACEDAP